MLYTSGARVGPNEWYAREKERVDGEAGKDVGLLWGEKKCRGYGALDVSSMGGCSCSGIVVLWEIYRFVVENLL